MRIAVVAASSALLACASGRAALPADPPGARAAAAAPGPTLPDVDGVVVLPSGLTVRVFARGALQGGRFGVEYEADSRHPARLAAAADALFRWALPAASVAGANPVWVAARLPPIGPGGAVDRWEIRYGIDTVAGKWTRRLVAGGPAQSFGEPAAPPARDLEAELDARAEADAFLALVDASEYDAALARAAPPLGGPGERERWRAVLREGEAPGAGSRREVRATIDVASPTVEGVLPRRTILVELGFDAPTGFQVETLAVQRDGPAWRVVWYARWAVPPRAMPTGGLALRPRGP